MRKPIKDPAPQPTSAPPDAGAAATPENAMSQAERAAREVLAALGTALLDAQHESNVAAETDHVHGLRASTARLAWMSQRILELARAADLLVDIAVQPVLR